MQRAVEVGLINDSRFADVYIRSKISQGWGPLKIKTEISKKGIEVETLPGWPDAYFSDVDEFEIAYSLAQRKHLSGKNDYEKLVRFLASVFAALSACIARNSPACIRHLLKHLFWIQQHQFSGLPA